MIKHEMLNLVLQIQIRESQVSVLVAYLLNLETLGAVSRVVLHHLFKKLLLIYFSL